MMPGISAGVGMRVECTCEENPGGESGAFVVLGPWRSGETAELFYFAQMAMSVAAKL